jgi:hypothetical protein
MGTCTRFNKTSKKVADAITKTVMIDLWDYRPLTVRQVYYQLVSKLIIKNKLSEYKKVSKILVKLRVDETIPWMAIHDTTRTTTEKRGYSNVGLWLRDIFRSISPEYYGRCYVQNQPAYVEVSLEKQALASIVESELWPFCTRLNVIRGQSSATLVEEISKRFDRAIMRGQKPILLHYGDLDPSGIAIPKAIEKNLKDRHGIDAEVVRIGLTPEQVKKYQLPQSIDAVKKKDPNYKSWVARYGENQTAVELDALHPETLKEILRESLYQVYDMEGMAHEKERERKDREMIRQVKKDIHGLLSEKYPEIYEGLHE